MTLRNRIESPFVGLRSLDGQLSPLLPFALAYDLFTLPLQISNLTLGFPPILVPGLGNSPSQAVGGVGENSAIQGRFRVTPIKLTRNAIVPQSVISGGQAYGAVAINFDGTISNTGNATASNLIARLSVLGPTDLALSNQAVVSQNLGDLTPGGSTAISIQATASEQDPPGDFYAVLEILQGSVPLAEVSSATMGTIEATTGIIIDGAFGGSGDGTVIDGGGGPPPPPTGDLVTVPLDGSTAPGAQLAVPPITFTWPLRAEATQYWLYLGTQGISSSNLLNESQNLNLSRVVTSLPLTGGVLYVRLWIFAPGDVIFNDYTFTLPL